MMIMQGAVVRIIVQPTTTMKTVQGIAAEMNVHFNVVIPMCIILWS